jgi:hypothetical protein
MREILETILARSMSSMPPKFKDCRQQAFPVLKKYAFIKNTFV